MKPVDVSDLAALGFALETRQDEAGLRLVLRALGEPKMSPLAVDFLEPKILHRLKHGLSKNQPLPRSLGVKSLDPDQAPYVFDATAGMGIDAFFIAALGCKVRAVERSPVVARLLADGLRRLHEASEEAEAFAQLSSIGDRLSFEELDARVTLARLKESERPDVVYLDPMYPEEGRSESALPKKAMQMFRKLIGDDLDAKDLFKAALHAARARVVVKRPVHAEPIDGTPSHVFEGKTARYDMYLV